MNSGINTTNTQENEENTMTEPQNNQQTTDSNPVTGTSKVGGDKQQKDPVAKSKEEKPGDLRNKNKGTSSIDRK